MPFRVELNPLKRIGGKLPLKRVAKGKDKTRKQMQKEVLQRQLFDFWSINAEALDENKKLANQVQMLLDRLNRRNQFYLDKIKKLEKTIADQEDLLADALQESPVHVEDVQHVNELLRGRIDFQQQLIANNSEKIVQQNEEMRDLREILRAVGYE